MYVYEAYTFMNIEPHTATNQLQMCVYGGRHIATLAEAAWLGNLHNAGGQFMGNRYNQVWSSYMHVGVS